MSTPAIDNKPKSIHKKVKLTSVVQDARGKQFFPGCEIELIADFSNGNYQAKLPNGTSIYCGSSVLDLASVVDFEESPKEASKEVKQEMLSGDDLKVGKGSEKAKEQQAIRKYRDARYIYSRACEMGCKDVESACEKYINEELVPSLPKDYKIPMDSYCFSKEEITSSTLTPEELKAVVDFSKTVDKPVKKEEKVVEKTPEKVTEPVVKVSGLTLPSKKYADFEGGASSFADFDVVGVQKGSTVKEVMVDGVKHIERSIPVFFRTGDYPDKKDDKGIPFSMTVDEGKEAVKDFTENLKAAPIVISHKPTVLDDHNTATLVNLEMKTDTENKVGTFSAVARLPEWLDKFVVKSGKMGISARWGKNKDGKKVLVHGALVPDPRIEDAAVRADFEKGLIAEFEGNIPYDAPPMAGDTTPAPEDLEDPQNGEAKPLHGKELGSAIEEELQMTIDDIARDPERHAKKYIGILQEMLARAKKLQGSDSQDDTDTDPAISTPNGQQDTTNGKDFSKENETLTTEVTTLKNEIASLRDENDSIRSTSVATVAKHLKKIVPADFDSTVSSLKRAAKDDRALGTTDFSKGDSRFISLTKTLMGKETHPLMISTADLQVLSGDKATDFETQEKEAKEHERYLSYTEEGRALLAQRKAKAASNGHAKLN